MKLKVLAVLICLCLFAPYLYAASNPSEIRESIQELTGNKIKITSVNYVDSQARWIVEATAVKMPSFYDCLQALHFSDKFDKANLMQTKHLEESNLAYAKISIKEDTRDRIPQGEGLIKGRIIKLDKIYINLRISLVLNDELYTSSAVVKENGSFVIPVEPGKYTYRGYEVKYMDKSRSPLKTESTIADHDESGTKIYTLSVKPGEETQLKHDIVLEEGIKVDTNCDKAKTACFENIYSEAGSLLSETQYKDGKMDGVRKIYRLNGELMAETNYKADKEHGVKRFFYDNGNVKFESVFDNGIRQGPIKAYRENGTLEGEGFLKNGKYDGVFKTYDEKGGIIKKDYFKEGKLLDDTGHPKNGIKKTYYPNGNVKSEMPFVDGEPVGVAKNYYEDGGLYSEVTIEKGNAVPVRLKVYDKQGNVVSDRGMPQLSR